MVGGVRLTVGRRLARTAARRVVEGRFGVDEPDVWERFREVVMEAW
jgi:hypothetical protein